MDLVGGTIGIDVSVHQGPIDWQAVADSDVAWAYIKSSEGTDFFDPRWEANRDGADHVGLPWSGYHFARPSPSANLDDARAEARTLIRRGGNSGPLGGVLDLESTVLGRQNTVDWARAFLEQLHGHNDTRLPWLYVGAYFLGNPVADNVELIGYPWIMPSYTASGSINPNPRTINGPGQNGAVKNCQIWQYTSEGRCPGVRGNVDKNISANGFNVGVGPVIPLSHIYVFGDVHPDIYIIQQIVGAPQTGVYGSATVSGVSLWQEHIGVTVDGAWGPSTARRTSEVFRWLAAVQEDADIRILVVDGRDPLTLAGWIVGQGPWKQWVPTVDYLDLYRAAIARGDISNMRDVGMRTHGDPYIAQLDLAVLVGAAPPP